MSQVNCHVIYLDIVKAFDRVNHGLVAHKLKEMGITGKTGQWLMEFLCDRVQSVLANNELSNEVMITLGPDIIPYNDPIIRGPQAGLGCYSSFYR